jgi:fatty-acyl-CoA synthase
MSRGPVEASTVQQLLVETAERFADDIAITFPDERITYGKLWDDTRALAAALHARGIGRGDRVAVLASNRPEFLHLMFASAWLGAVFVPISPRYRRTELDYVLPNAAPAIVFASTEGGRLDLEYLLGSFLQNGRSDRVITLHEEGIDETVGISYESFLDTSSPSLPGPITSLSSDVFSIIYTSGTTAHPKGVQINHYAEVQHPFVIGRDAFGMQGPESMYAPLPLYYQGCHQPLMFTLAWGGKVVLLPHFEPELAAAMIERESCTIGWPGFPLLLDPLLDAELAGDQLGRFRACMMHATPPEVRRLQERLPSCAFLPVWGCTEGGGAISMGRFDDPVEHRVTTNGRLLEGFDVAVLDDEGRPLPRGEEGELAIRGGAVSPGYYGETEANAAFRSGTFMTGDLGRLTEDGTILFRGRRKGLIKVGGVNVSPAEIEEFLMRHPLIRLAQVVGIPDQKYGEVPVAFIELAPEGSLEARDVIDYCRGEISRDRVPRHVRFVSEWPMSTTKVQKHVLRDGLLAEIAQTA